MANKTLIDERLRAITGAREIHELAGKEKRKMTDEEDVRYSKFMDEAHDIGEQLKRDAKFAEIDSELDKPTEPEERDEDRDQGREKKETREDLENNWTRAFLQGGSDAASAYQRETRDLAKDSNVLGGYWMAPETFMNEFIQAVDNAVLIRGLARKLKVGAGHSIAAPSLDTDVSDATWTAEAQIATKDTTARIGKRSLTPHPLSKLVQVSKDLIDRTGAAEKFAAERIAYKMAVTEEKAFMTGSGAQQPLGLFTASDDGISTDRDVATGNTNTTIKGDGLISTKGKLKGQYHAAAKWIMHRDIITAVSKLKDGISSEYAPNTQTSGLYAGILGDYSNYWIADAGTMGMQRLIELYAATNQIGLLARRHLDGMPVLEEAFVRVTYT